MTPHFGRRWTTHTPIVDTRTDWMLEAACLSHDPELWYPPKGQRYNPHYPNETTLALQVCRGCPVIAECLTYALTNRIDTGIWGGLTESRREQLRRDIRRRHA